MSNILCVDYIHKLAGHIIAGNLEFQEDYKKAVWSIFVSARRSHGLFQGVKHSSF